MEVGRTASAHHWFEWRKKTDFVGRAGRFQQKQMENVLRRYVKEYVTCHTCRSPDTILQKETRLFFLQCETCGSRCSVASIKSGFQVRHSLHLDFVDRLTSWSFIFALLFFVMLRFIRFFQCELDFVANVGLVLFYSETNCFFYFFTPGCHRQTCCHTRENGVETSAPSLPFLFVFFLFGALEYKNCTTVHVSLLH